jgi:hypothetical protein
MIMSVTFSVVTVYADQWDLSLDTLSTYTHYYQSSLALIRQGRWISKNDNARMFLVTVTRESVFLGGKEAED